MRRLALLAIVVLGLPHVHCVCGGAGTVLGLVYGAPETATLHRPLGRQQICAADNGTVPRLNGLADAPAVATFVGLARAPRPSPRYTSLVSQPDVPLSVLHLTSAQAPRAPPFS